jgi:5-methylcytosine-specific restriction endonuclease McrA
VSIKGKNGKATFKCHWVAVSKYRDEIAFVLNQVDSAPIIRKLTPLQPARRKMLDTITPNSTMSPADFYKRTLIDAGTQVNARRRWGELRTEYGFGTTFTDVEFARHGELPINEPSPRPHQNRLNAEYFKTLYEEHQGKCAKCGISIRPDDEAEGEKGLLDHRRPVPYGGGDEKANLQLFCTTCNNLKATACQRCPLKFRCECCTWAHPEKFHDAIVLRFTPAEAQRLVEAANARQKKPEALAIELFKSAFDSF